MARRVGEAALPGAPAQSDDLERALPALVADRAVERMVDQQELDDRVLRLVDAIGLGVDHHPVADRGGAGGLQLRHSLDLDQAHAAGPDRLAELRLVTEDRDLDVALLGGVDQHRPLRRGDLAAVDDQGDGVADRPGHAASLSGTPLSIASMNSSRYFCTIAPTGIAIESPRTQRQLPMMLVCTEATVSRSIGVASPRIIRSSIFTVQLVPSRQGVHLPQDSWW